MLLAPLWTLPALILSADCNRNGIEDSLEVAAPVVDFSTVRTLPIVQVRWLLPFDREGDGDPDLAAHDDGAGRIVLFENRGGDFVEAETIDGLEGVRSVSGGDLDGDGDLDLALAAVFSVRVLWNDRVFQVRDTGMPVGADPWRILATDVDRDGDLDLVTANFLAGSPVDDSVSIITNRGAGDFDAPRNVGAHKGLPLLAAGDLDGDADPDLVTAALEATRLILLENRPAGFARKPERLELSGFPAEHVIFSDLEGVGGDGSEELLVTGSWPGLLVLGRAPGEVLPAVKQKIDLGPRSRVLPTDLDGDRTADLVAPAFYGCPDFQVLLGIGDGSGRFASPLPVLAGHTIHTVAAADWNGDGNPDLAGSDFRGGLTFHLQRPALRSRDCNQNRIPDECEADCNRNGTPDDCDLAAGASADCDRNSLPDECDPDCDSNGIPDVCDLRSGKVPDCDRNGVPDSCELAGRDRDGNGLLDDCETASGAVADCNRNGIPDQVDLEPSFELPYPERRVGGLPMSIAAADLDGDGDREVVTGDYRQGGISVLRNLPGGALGVRNNGSLGAHLVDLAVLDADADGDLDLAAALQDESCNLQGWVAILRNENDLPFRQGSVHPLGRGPRFLLAGHLDRDGFPDLIASTVYAYGPNAAAWWLHGRGDGRFELPQTVAERGGPLALADLDRDGDDDLAFASGSLIQALGDGAFVEVGDLPIGGSLITAVDFDVDGNVDFLVAGDEANGYRLVLNQGDRTFSVKDLRLGQPSFSFQVADLQGDGLPDVVLLDLLYRPALLVLPNRGAGDFGPETAFPLGMIPRPFTAGDIDGDGDLDIAGALGQAGSALVLRNRGDGTFRTGATYALGSAPTSMEAIDLDGDGDLDVAGIRIDDSRLLVFENDGRASFQEKWAFKLDRQPFAFSAADLNGDGRPDLALTEFTAGTVSESGVSLFFNRGGWRFERGPRLTAGDFSVALKHGDLDGDGDLDLLALNRNSNDVRIFWNDGGAFDRSARLEVDPLANLLVVSRLDADALPDLLIGRPGELRVFRNLGGGQFERGEAFTGLEEAQAAVAGDLDRDGDNDLVFGVFRGEPCPAAGTRCGVELGVAFNAGNGTWERVERYPAGWRDLALSLSDLDGDRDLDVIAAVANEDGWLSVFTVLLNAGDGSLKEAERMTIDGGFRFASLETADLNGDGTPDLLWADGVTLTVLPGRRRPPASLDSDRDGLPDECRPRAFRRGDADGTGRVELTDAIVLLGHLFLGERQAVLCPDGADADDNGILDITDAIRLLGWLFLAGGPPAAPGPEGCGEDPTSDLLGFCLEARC